MNKIEERLSRAIESAPSLSVEGLKKAEIQKMEEHDYITRQQACRRHVHVFFAHAESADTSKGFCYH